MQSCQQPQPPPSSGLPIGNPHRSTRGASKQRRDQINVEIQCLRDLLPLSDSVKDRLFQLQVMSLACIFIRKQRYLPHLMRPYGDPMRPPDVALKAFDSCKAMKGFLMMVTRNGKMLYISENASEYLGHSVEEIMCQGDSVYDLVDLRDQGAVRAELLSGPVPPGAPFPEHRVFICRMNLSRTAKRQLQYHKFVLIQGRYVQPADYFPGLVPGPSSLQPVFAAFCQPLLNPENAESLSNGNTTVFTSQHFMDMRFKEMDVLCAHHLGYSRSEIAETSWYSLLHPAHLEEVSYKHRLLCQEKEGSVLCLLRLQAANGEWLWMHTVLAVRGNFLHEVQDGRRVRHVITATYQLLNELEAATLQANAWIYSIRHSFPSTFPCKDAESPESGERPFTPASPFPAEPFIKSEPAPPTPVFPTVPPQPTQPPPAAAAATLPSPFPFHLAGEQIKVEIPSKLPSCALGGPSLTLNSLFDTPEHSSPESSTSSFPFGLLPSASSSSSSTSSNRLLLDGMSELLHAEIAAKETLPELRDDLDEFFKQVEYPLLSDSFSSPSLGSSSSPPFGGGSSTAEQPIFAGMGGMLGSPVAPVSGLGLPQRHSPTEAPDLMKLLHSRFGTPSQPLLPSLPSLNNNNNNNCWPDFSQARHPWTRHHSVQIPDEFPHLPDPFQNSRKRLGSWAGV